jgi:hypothetical protein
MAAAILPCDNVPRLSIMSDILCFRDADGQHNPNDISCLTEKFEAASAITCTRTGQWEDSPMQ